MGRKPMTAVPRILFVVPGILTGILVPAVIVSTPKPAPPNTVGMVNMDFTKGVVYLHRGQRLTFVDSSHNTNDMGQGNNGELEPRGRGEPLTGFNLMETNSVYTTGPWLTSGTF